MILRRSTQATWAQRSTAASRRRPAATSARGGTVRRRSGPRADDAREGAALGRRRGQDDVRRRVRDRVAVGEVAGRGEGLDEWVPVHRHDVVPAHVREPACAGQAAHGARQQPEAARRRPPRSARRAAAARRRRRTGSAPRPTASRMAMSSPADRSARHGGTCRPDAGDHDEACVRDLVRVGGDRRLDAVPRERGTQRTEVPGAVVHEDDAAHQRTPFVELMPARAGSGAQAVRSASAIALKAASARW